MRNKTLTVTLTSIAAFAGISGIANAEHSQNTNNTVPAQHINVSTDQKQQETVAGLTEKDIVKVKAGDTLYHIALSHKLSLEQVYAYNPGITALIHPGDLIAVSDKGAAELENSNVDYAQTYTESYSENHISETPVTHYQGDNNYKVTTTSAPVIHPSTIKTSYTNTSYNEPTHYNNKVVGNQGNHYYFGNCTYYAFDRRQQLGRSIGSYWGNANNWAYSAKNAGLAVDNRPEVGAIFQTNAGYYGHVGVVERVNQDGSVYVSEMNWNGNFNHVTNRTIKNVSSYNFIH
ncbi:CHAP domain-containing protein [Staphylococcus taiwanensis]|nr:CHAP domain-containing protein [Staphylococcus taiwanensis]